MKRAALSVALTLVLTLTACAAEPLPEETVAETTPTPTATPTPTPEPTRPAATELLVSPDGLGTIHIGATLPDTDDPDTALVVLTPDHCLAPEADYGEEPTEPGWTADPSLVSPTATYLNPDAGAPFSLGVDGSTVTRIDIRGSGPATAEGIQVGSKRADVLAAYPDAKLAFSSIISEVYQISGADSQLLIEVAVEGSGADGYWSGGAAKVKNRVLIMRIIPSTEKPRAVAGGDNVVFGCSYSGA
jgi:hypothetical protein